MMIDIEDVLERIRETVEDFGQLQYDIGYEDGHDIGYREGLDECDPLDRGYTP